MNDRTYEALRELLPAYALGALDAEDMRFVETHLSAYPDCERELVELQDSLAMLAFSVPAATPPPGAKAALLDRVEQSVPGRDAALRRLSGTPEIVAAKQELAPVHALPETRGGARGGRRGWRVALAALAAVLVLGLLSWGTVLQLRLRDEQQQLAAERQRNDALATQTMELAFINKLLNDPYAAHPVIGPTVSDYGLPAAGFIYIDPQSTTALMLTYWLPSIGADPALPTLAAHPRRSARQRRPLHGRRARQRPRRHSRAGDVREVPVGLGHDRAGDRERLADRREGVQRQRAVTVERGAWSVGRKGSNLTPLPASPRLSTLAPRPSSPTLHESAPTYLD